MENKEISFSHSDAMQALTIVSPKSDLLSIRLYRCLVEPCEIDSDDSDGRLGTNYKHFGDNEFGCLVEYTSIVLYSKQDSDPQDTTRRGVKFTAAFDARYDIAHDDFDEEEIKFSNLAILERIYAINVRPSRTFVPCNYKTIANTCSSTSRRLQTRRA